MGEKVQQRREEELKLLWCREYLGTANSIIKCVHKSFYDVELIVQKLPTTNHDLDWHILHIVSMPCTLWLLN